MMVAMFKMLEGTYMYIYVRIPRLTYLYICFVLYLHVLYQGSPQDFIKALGSSPSAVFIRYFNNKLLKGCCMASSATTCIGGC